MTSRSPHTRRDITDQIYLMMYGFGDSSEPNLDTVRLVETILRKQLKSIVSAAQQYWDGKTLRGIDLVFLLRHNKYKMQRFVCYLQHIDANKRVRMMGSNNTIPIDPPKVKHHLIEFVESIDETGEFLCMETDEIKYERMLRADRISRDLTEEKYLEFQRARCVSFKSGLTNWERILQWVDPTGEIKFQSDAMDVLCYFVFQTIAELVDLALLVREDSQAGGNPLEYLPPSYYASTTYQRIDRRRQQFNRTKTGPSQKAISPNEVQEAMRRVYKPMAGVLNFGGPIPETHFILAL